MSKGRGLGIGGVFVRSADPAGLCDWYRRCLGLSLADDFDGVLFPQGALPEKAYGVWSAFPVDSPYFEGTSKGHLINFVVDDVAAVLDRVRTNGGEVAEGPENTDYGVFGWVIDPEGNKIELWAP